MRKGISYSENGVGIPRSNDVFDDYGKSHSEKCTKPYKIRVKLDFLGPFRESETAFRKVHNAL